MAPQNEPVLEPANDPISLHYHFHPEHERLEGIYPSSITSPALTPTLPEPIGQLVGSGFFRDRNAFYERFMRYRARTLPRPFTPVEFEVLSRYTKNIQTGIEWWGFTGATLGIARGVYTGDWPLGYTFRRIMHDAGTDPIKGGMTPFRALLGLIFSSTAPPQSVYVPPTAPAVIDVLPKALDPSTPFNMESIPRKDQIGIPRLGKSLKNFVDKGFESLQDLAKNKPPETRAKDLSEIAKDKEFFETFHRRNVNTARLWAGYLEVMRQTHGPEWESTDAERQAFLRAMRRLKAPYQTLAQPMTEEHSLKIFRTIMLDMSEKIPPPSPRLPFAPFAYSTYAKLFLHAYIGKYIAVVLGISIITIRSTEQENRDEMLQEYHAEKDAYGKARFEEAMRKAQERRESGGLPFPARSSPPWAGPEPKKEEDTQSLGGLQPETILWTEVDDDVKQGQEASPSSILSRTDSEEPEATIDAGQKFREAAASHERREARNRGESIDDFSSPQQGEAGVSVWDRIRQQTNDREPSESRRTPGEGYSISSVDRERQSPKQQAQEEFDEQLEKERRGESESGGWRK